MAVLTTALTRLRSDYNERFPGRDKASDGWIGDPAHAASVSGHNPDETGNAEYRDADNKDEVRAVDIDKDLRDPDVTMLQTIQAILATPADLRRLRYIIFNGVIWSRSRNWQPARYTGSNKHDEHGHLSGDPDTDEDGRQWSVARIPKEDDMALTEAQAATQTADTWRLDALLANKPAAVYTITRNGRSESRTEPNKVREALDHLTSELGELAGVVQALADRPAPGTVEISDEQLERVLRRVIGSVDGASPAG